MNRRLLCLSLVVLTTAPVLADAVDPGAAVDRYFEAYQKMDLEQMLLAFAPDAVFVDVAQRHEIEGTDGLRELLGGLIAMHTEMGVEIKRRIASGNVVAVDYLYRGNLSGKALRAATGKTTCRDTAYRIPVTSWFEIEDGRIARQTDFIDLTTLDEVRAQASGTATP